MKITKLILETADTSTLASFYTRVLELSVERQSTHFSTQIGTTQLTFRQAAEGFQPTYHLAFNIPANKISEAKEWLSQKVDLLWMEDYQSDIADFVNWNAKSIYFFDTVGNILELIARFDLQNESEEPFSEQSFLSVNEVGLVFPPEQFDIAVSDLLQRFDFSYFSKQPPLPQFRAIGDDEGLFIAVPAERQWYPTTAPSKTAPTEVVFQHQGKQHSLQLS